jgi:hypothetical protein
MILEVIKSTIITGLFVGGLLALAVTLDAVVFNLHLWRARRRTMALWSKGK